MMKILVTGFDPFGGEKVNPAYEAVKLLPKEIKGAEIIAIEIPTVFDRGPEAVKAAMEKYKPDAVLNVGQAGGRAGITVEKVAINYVEARIPDNDGKQPSDQALREDGETAYFTTLPIKAMVENMRKNGVASSISYTAGTYVCNTVMYTTLYNIEKEFPGTIGGFIHVPFDIGQVLDKPNMASMPVETIAKGLEYAIEAIVDYKEKDLQINLGGTIQ